MFGFFFLFVFSELGRVVLGIVSWLRFRGFEGVGGERIVDSRRRYTGCFFFIFVAYDCFFFRFLVV